MKLRSELQPPKLDEELVSQLSELANSIDGADSQSASQLVENFNSLSGLTMNYIDFQGIYGAEQHSDWVRRILSLKLVKIVDNVTRDELIEVLRRTEITPDMTQEEYLKAEAYEIVFNANVPMPNASSLLYYPLDYDARSNTWNGGRPISEYSPSLEEVVDTALSYKPQVLYI